MGDNSFLTFSDNYKNHIDIWFKAYNISYEKLSLYYDFLMSLYELIDKTYLGNDVIITDENQKEHFDWCWKKVINNFEKEKINFKYDGYHYEYFWNFFKEAFYHNKSIDENVKILQYFKILFDFNHTKTRSEIDVLTELYKIFNESLKK